MELTLNIYKNNKEIEKTYKASEFDLMWGTMEDLLSAVGVDGLDNLNDTAALSKIISALLPQVKPLLKQIFDGVTDSEIRRTKAKELVPIFIEAFTYAFSELGVLSNKSGN
ncbi:MAG: hypothetical protein K2H01_01585 [Ruminococcus sp.]|nr:hypothetical protein [Ruminococcus sp.]